MLFEKGKKSKRNTLEGVVWYSTLSIICLFYIATGLVWLVDIFGDKIKLIEGMSVIAQLATAFAFLLALKQYIKNSTKERQTKLSDEAIAQVVKLNEVISDISVGADTNLENLNSCITKLANLAINFNAIFESLQEDIYKAIVRMHWQDMYFNKLSPALNNLSIEAILKKEAPDIDNIDFSIYETKEILEKSNTIEVFKDFVFIETLLESSNVKEYFSLEGKIESLDSFACYFLNNSNLNDHLFGLLSKVDIRAKAPLLAAAKPAAWALNKVGQEEP